MYRPISGTVIEISVYAFVPYVWSIETKMNKQTDLLPSCNVQ